jgi:TRAP-type mannitol/chloroaromatic compound transport system permease large subunit
MFASGVVAESGTLGNLVPPSMMLVIMPTSCRSPSADAGHYARLPLSSLRGCHWTAPARTRSRTAVASQAYLARNRVGGAGDGADRGASFPTPPVGFSLFYMKGVVPPGVTTKHIYYGIIPFVIIQLVAVAIVFLWPELVLWLPRKVYGSV